METNKKVIPNLCVFRLRLENMHLLRALGPWVLVVLLGYQVRASSLDPRGADPSGTGPRGRALVGGGKAPATGRGKFLIDGGQEQKMQCTWVAQDVHDEVALSVKCEDPEARVRGGVTELQCAYTGRPQLCRGYRSNPKGFWKQVSRAFKRLQTKVCADDRALVRTGMCKVAPRGAHFKLDINTSVTSAQSGGVGVGVGGVDDDRRLSTPEPSACDARSRRRAEEHCDGSWVSLCALLFSMVEHDC